MARSLESPDGPLVAIHQPNFLPWLGWFDKLARADVLVLLDDVQFPKKGGTWINRVKLDTGSGPTWMTVPIDRAYHGTRTIAEMRLEEARPWREKLVKTLRQSYSRAQDFATVMPVVEEIVGNPEPCLAAYNESAIRSLCDRLGLDQAKLRRSSELAVDGTATERLVSIVQAVGGRGYLAGGGAQSYQQDDLFAAAGLELVSQDFEHPAYARGDTEFVSGLSVVDALMHCGFDGTAALLDRG